jgi:hypothetical protein
LQKFPCRACSPLCLCFCLPPACLPCLACPPACLPAGALGTRAPARRIQLAGRPLPPPPRGPTHKAPPPAAPATPHAARLGAPPGPGATCAAVPGPAPRRPYARAAAARMPMHPHAHSLCLAPHVVTRLATACCRCR